MSDEPRSRRLLDRMKRARLKERIIRLVGIGVLLFLVGVCAIVVVAVVWQLQVAIALGAGLLSMGAAFYLFVKLWPEAQEEETSVVARSLERAREKPKPRELTPEEYRRQREAAQRLIREKAAPTLAKAIRGILRQEEERDRRRKR